MEKLWSCDFHIPFCRLLLSLLLFFSVQFLSRAYNLPDKYFVNCGSATNIKNASRNFIGDLNSDTFRFSSDGSSEVNDWTDAQSLYDSARIFRQPSFYEFGIDQTAVHIVRLHFFPVNSSTDLSAARFDVSASGFFLLQNFTAKNISNDPPSIKEFFLRLNSGKFRVFFLPKSSSIAYINAIEVFPTPPNFIPADAPLISPTGSNGKSEIFPSPVLHTIYRINVGGPEISADGDNLWRTWDPDDGYLVNRSSAKDSNPFSDKPNYKEENDKYFAPDLVYQTAKQMNKTSDDSFEFFNITWSFSVRKDATHFLRVHFFDIIGLSVNNVLFFNLYIGDRFNKTINPDAYNNGYTVPFHYDFLVDSGESGFVSVSVGPLNDSVQRNAYLNGLEIMEPMEEHSIDPVISESEEKKKHVPLVVGSAVGGFGFVCIFVSVIWFGLKHRKPKTVEASVWSRSPLQALGGGSSHSRLTERTITGSPVPHLNLGLKFSLAEIQAATNKFSKKFLVGEGGFGKVYRGIVRNNMKVAVKRSQPGAGQGFSEFEREIMILSRIRHRHLVSLIGYCDERFEMILVYEFMEKGTLREHLYNSKLPPLSWKKRLEICIGAARGIHYLHKGSAGGIIHRDIKSTNILLDENLVAKVADFGLSRAGPLDETHVSTGVKGTFGYLDPEYFRTQQLTEKSDVYSFGVLLLEILCARPALNPSLPREQINLAEWGMKCKKMDLLENIIDPKLEGQIDPNSLRKFIDTTEKCLQEDATERPAMGDVLWDLEYALQLQQTAQRRMPHEDSATNANSNSSATIQRFPSIGSSIIQEDRDISEKDDGSGLTESVVFSQMKADEGR